MKKTISVGDLFNLIARGEQPKCVTYDRHPMVWSNSHKCYVYGVNGNTAGILLKAENALCVVECDTPVLDRLEKKYLSDVIRPFRSRVRGIKKKRLNYVEHIEVYVMSGAWINVISFPEFKTGTMYEGMEPEKEYKPKELGI